jgi:hypothetical protein
VHERLREIEQYIEDCLPYMPPGFAQHMLELGWNEHPRFAERLHKIANQGNVRFLINGEFT